MEKITLSAPAKINLTLRITGRRADGYHTLESVMQEISLADTVQVEKIPQGIFISCNKDHIPTGEKNICYRAAAKYFEESRLSGGVKITLKKNIPDGAGMGGGSSDGAAVLKALSHLYPSKVDLAKIAVKIGADVPFFLTGKTALCQGIGEEITPIDMPFKSDLYCVVAKDCEGLSTPRIYSLFDEMTTKETGAKRKAFSLPRTAEELLNQMENDLELPAIFLQPRIAQLKDMLLGLGADGAMMTGSGSAVFGLFRNALSARSAAEEMRRNGIYAQFCTLL